MSIYYQDESVTLHLGDALEEARTMPDQSVDCIVTSPPYFGLRDYGNEGQYGAEASPAEYVETMHALFAELRRVLADDGTLWVNLGDTYAPGKNLLGIPWRVAFALQDDGWTLRNDIIWNKPNAMPDPTRDRLTNRHEHVFMFSKSRNYRFDLDAVRVRSDYVGKTWEERKAVGEPARRGVAPTALATHRGFSVPEGGRNPGDVWEIATQPFPGAHFAVFPVALPERCILAGCKPGGTVLDPFSGSGTTGMAAAKHGRKYVGIDLNADYLDLSLRTRLLEPSLDFGGAV